MKVNVNYTEVHIAMRKMEKQSDLTADEMEAVLKVLKAVQGDYIPSKLQLDAHRQRVHLLDQIDMDAQEERFNQILEECKTFDRQYC
ncbi:hypothetical protein [Lysinibacillus sphaericus]|uniref:hypothetical protein n=1 Tax=Lysinibacillus sphaericus TaxID=1421 RepID=UPI00056C5144|nr:hypothetical protein [Lysinibacillus sphaericus]